MACNDRRLQIFLPRCIIRDLCTAYIDRGIGCIDKDHHRRIFLKNLTDVKKNGTLHFIFVSLLSKGRE